MNTLDDRERAFEAKFAHDAQLQFNATARRNHLLGQWAAALLNKTQEETKAYTNEIQRLAMQAPGDDDVMRKLTHDLGDRVDAQTIHAQVKALMLEAKQQIRNQN